MTVKSTRAYADRFRRVLDYIERHLDENLTVEGLSRVAIFSKYHFHRHFSGYAGMTVGRYIEVMRLRRASYQQAFNREPVDAVHRVGDSARRLYREWLPESSEELRDFPMFFQYVKMLHDTPEHELVTDIYLPLK